MYFLNLGSLKKLEIHPVFRKGREYKFQDGLDQKQVTKGKIVFNRFIYREAVFALAHPGNDNWRSDSRAWSFPVRDGEMMKVFKKHELFDKQKMFTEKMIGDMYRLIHLGIYTQPDLPRWSSGEFDKLFSSRRILYQNELPRVKRTKRIGVFQIFLKRHLGQKICQFSSLI